MRKPGFILNLHDRKKNPCFESHDPGMMYDPVSGFYYSYSTDGAITSPYRQGIQIRKSKNLVEFEYVGMALSEAAIAEGRDNGEYPPTGGFWAPFTEYVNGEYRMYYSATKAFGSSESRIWLAVAAHPEGPFENRGVVADTWGTTNAEPNAIDAHVVDTPEGRKYLVYGSFFGGIFIKELDPETGLCLGQLAKELGTRIAVKPEHSYIDGPEGAAVLYHPELKKYLLFLSYGWLGDDYDIRVGISERVEGPYLDRDGKSLNGVSLGQKLAGSYRFSANQPYAADYVAVQKDTGCVENQPEDDNESEAGSKPSGDNETEAGSKPCGDNEPEAGSKSCGDNEPEAKIQPEEKKKPESELPWEFGGFRGPGHGVPFYQETAGQYYFVHHVRDGAWKLHHGSEKQGDRLTFFMHYMMVRRMYFVEGWPVFAPEPYAEEPSAKELTEEQCVHFRKENSLWEKIEFSNTDNKIKVGSSGTFPEDFACGVCGTAFDFENGGECEVVSGYLKNNHAVWLKRKQEKL